MSSFFKMIKHKTLAIQQYTILYHLCIQSNKTDRHWSDCNYQSLINHQAKVTDVQTSTLNSRQPFGISITPVSPCWPAKLIQGLALVVEQPNFGLG